MKPKGKIICDGRYHMVAVSVGWRFYAGKCTCKRKGKRQ